MFGVTSLLASYVWHPKDLRRCIKMVGICKIDEWYPIYKKTRDAHVCRRAFPYWEWAGANWYSTQDKLGILMPTTSIPSGRSSISASIFFCRKSQVDIAKGKKSAPKLWSTWQYMQQHSKRIIRIYDCFNNNNTIFGFIIILLSSSKRGKIA